MTLRPSLLDLVREAWPRIGRMGHDAIAQAHVAGVPAWVSDDQGRIVRLDPDGTEHVETRFADEVTVTRPVPAAEVPRVAARGGAARPR